MKNLIFIYLPESGKEEVEKEHDDFISFATVEEYGACADAYREAGYKIERKEE